jgi:hypothetical protein
MNPVSKCLCPPWGFCEGVAPANNDSSNAVHSVHSPRDLLTERFFFPLQRGEILSYEREVFEVC